MPVEEVLRYRVEIDQADLASQLSSLKSQIDQALGSFAFSGASQLPSFDPLIGGISNFTSAAATASQTFQQSIIDSQNFFRGGLETGRLGYQKFINDAQAAGLISPPEYAHQFSSMYAATRDYVPRAVEEAGVLKAVVGARFGIGHDPNMAISRGEYMRAMSDTAEQKALGSVVTTASIAAGLLGMGGPLSVAGIGLGVVSASLKAMAYEPDATKTFGNFIERTSFRNLAPLSKDEAIEAARGIRDLSGDINIRATVGDATDVENIIVEAVSAGMFRDVQNVTQYKQRAKDTLENFRVVQHAINGMTEDALEVMGDLMQMGLANTPGEAARVVLQARSIGDMSGYSTKEMLEIARSGGEMVRGTGVSMRVAAQDAMAMTGFVRQGAYDGTFSRELLLEAGGSNRIALELARMGNEFGGSATGRMYGLARSGGFNFSQGLDDLMSTTIAGLGSGSPNDIIEAFTSMREDQRTASPTEQLFRKAHSVREFMNIYNID